MDGYFWWLYVQDTYLNQRIVHYEWYITSKFTTIYSYIGNRDDRELKGWNKAVPVLCYLAYSKSG